MIRIDNPSVLLFGPPAVTYPWVPLQIMVWKGGGFREGYYYSNLVTRYL